MPAEAGTQKNSLSEFRASFLLITQHNGHSVLTEATVLNDGVGGCTMVRRCCDGDTQKKDAHPADQGVYIPLGCQYLSIANE